jgi:hypothetical protein
MSEFSRCLYLRSERREEGIELVGARGSPGYVFAPENGWVQMVVGSDEARAEICRDASGLVVDYQSAADHEWSFSLFEGGEQVARFVRTREGERRRELHGASIEECAELFGVAEERLSDVLDPGERPSDFCELVGLPNYSWISFRYLDQEVDSDPDAVYVAADGTAVAPDARTAALEESLRDATPTVEESRNDEASPADRETALARAFVERLVERELVMLEADTDEVQNAVADDLAEAIRGTGATDVSRLVEIWEDELMNCYQVLALLASNRDLAAAAEEALEVVDA